MTIGLHGARASHSWTQPTMIFTERTTRATLTLLPQLTPALTTLMKPGQMRAKVNHLLNESTWGRLWKIWGATLKKIRVTRRTLIRVLRHRQRKEAMTSLKTSCQR